MEPLLHLRGKWLAILFVWLVPCAAPARSAEPLCALLSDARITAGSIYLSDLLPVQASSVMREQAARISLGSAPPPGGTTTVEGERISRMLSEPMRSEISIPPQVVIHRTGRLVTSAEVITAIRASLRYNGLPDDGTLAPENIQFSPSVMVSATDAKLRVRRMDFDAALNQDRFLLVSSADPRALPFLVLAGRQSIPRENPSEGVLDIGAGSENSGRSLREAPSEAHSAKFYAAATPLVEPRKPARLHVTSGSMQMFLQVVPMEKGGLHDMVRVKLLGSGTILRGQVTAPGQMEAQF
jgi:hypothetical protein